MAGRGTRKHNTTGTLQGEAPGSGKPAEAANPELGAVDALQLALDLAGMVPGAGAVPDIINAAISALRGDWIGAGLSLFSAVPAIGDAAGAAKILKNSDKYLQALKVVETKVIPKLPDSMAKPLQDFISQARSKIDDLMSASKAKPELPKKDPQVKDKPKEKSTGEDKNNAQVKKKNSGEKGKCGEWLAKMDMIDDGFDEVVSVQNNSGHGIDLIGRNSQTGEVKVWEVKTTDGARPPNMSRDQRSLGGKDFAQDRLGRAARGEGNYGKVPEAQANARKSQKWIERANGRVTYEKREVFVDDLEKGCQKNPKKPSRSKSWNAKQ